MPLHRVSQRDIALRANVHFTTVSLALRDSRTLPEETRLRIQKLAKEMGYRPDPMLSALQAYRKSAKSPGFEGTIAWINTHKLPTNMQTSRLARMFFAGAKERCDELGYRLEEFNLHGMTTARLSKILQARNIQALLLPPQPHNRAHLNFDWENYSAVTFGYSLSRPRLHVVANAQYSSARTGMRELRKYGYRRIGFVTTRNSDERTDQNFSSGYLTEQRRAKPSEQVPMLVLDDDDPSGRPGHQKLFHQWYKKYRPAAILAFYEAVSPFMENLKIPYSECGLAMVSLGTAGEKGIAGIDENDMIIGRSAVDFVVGMVHRNERGIPETPLRILVDGKWVEGKSVFHQYQGETAKKKWFAK